MTRDAYCSYCGTAYPVPSVYPRRCPDPGCGREVWANPIPVAVVLVPVTHEGRLGLLVVRRGIEPQRGRLALVGGFVEEEESWQAAGAREVLEETGILIDASALTPLWFASTEPRPNRVLLFATAPVLEARALPPHRANEEAPERGLVYGPEGLDAVFAFPLHGQAARRFFADRGGHGPCDYGVV
jgi:ADP-ribose pyrophosphatase YjhB (NUDIX family)